MGRTTVFHGTTLASAEKVLVQGFRAQDKRAQAEIVCRKFGATLDDVLRSEAGAFFSGYKFVQRPVVSSTRFFWAAADYARRGAEWEYHLKAYLVSLQVGVSWNPVLHQPEIEAELARYREPAAVVALDVPSDQVPAYEYDEFSSMGSPVDEVVLELPLPADYRIAGYFLISDDCYCGWRAGNPVTFPPHAVCTACGDSAN